jgi:FkbM family methyltransferase
MKLLPNGIAVIDGDTHISKWVEESGRLDHDQYALPIILKHIKDGDYVVDAGAFIGDHTIAYLNAVRSAGGRVYAFEPNPSAFECLTVNCKDAYCFRSGLGDKEEFISIKQSENVGASHLTNDESGSISVVTLDSYNLDRLDFFKIDVEGYEMKALKGAEQTISKYKPKMWIEINRGALEKQNTKPEDIFSFLISRGYNIAAYPELIGDQYDILCTAK